MARFSSFRVVLQKDESLPSKPQQTFVEADLPDFHKAAAYGNLQTLYKLFEEDHSVLQLRSHDGLTPLAQAVQSQQLEAVRLLIKLGADVNAQDNVGRTCLSVAAYQGWHEGVVSLLHNGARHDICDKSGRYPLHAATYHSDTNTLSLLLQSLTSKEVNQPDHELMTAVHWAAFHDRPDHLMQLVQKGGDILAKDIDGKLPLHWAAQNGSFQCAHRLTSLSDGLATVNSMDNTQKSPAHYAAAAGSANILTVLSHCDNINLEIEDPDERTPLHWAAATGHSKVVDTLLKLGVNPLPTDVDGCTPLDYAIQGDNEACVKAMENVLGLKSNKLSLSRHDSGGRPQALAPELKYLYKKDAPPKPAHAAVPHINVLPATTTISATDNTAPTTVVDMPEGDGDQPRMYSASTDTDAYDFPSHQLANVGHMTQSPMKGGGNALSSLISSSFMAGAHGPVLIHDVPQESRKLVDPKDKREQSSGKDKWGYQTNSGLPSIVSHPNEFQELKVTTSTNTPDLNRVSVQSFRSIPPINDRSDGPLPEHVSRLTRRSSKNSPAHGNSSQRTDVKLPPLNPEMRKLSQFGNLTPVSPATSVEASKMANAKQALPHDFMTDNVAETRILTRMWRNAAREIIHQLPPPRRMVVPPLFSAGKDASKVAFNVSPLQSSRSNKDNSVASALIKHSRIPSTRMLPTNNKLPVSNKTRDKAHKKTNNINVAITPFDTNDCDREKYLEDEGSSKPLTPRPLIPINVSKNGGKTKSSEPYHEQMNKLRSKTKEMGANKSKRNLQKLSNRFGNVSVPDNRPMNVVEEKIMDIPSLYKGDKRKDGRRPKHERKVAIAHQMAYS